MIPRSIRFRLSAWYFATLFLALTAFGIGTFLTMRRSLYETVDDALRERINGVRNFFGAQPGPPSGEEVRQEFREHSVLGPGGDLFEVCDARGNWIYRSAALERNGVGIRLPDQLPRRGLHEDLEVQNRRLRALSVRIVVRGEPFTVLVAAPTDELTEALTRYRWTLFLLIPGALILASGGGYWISRRALSPVDRIIRDAQSISSQSLQKRLDVPVTGDELQRLSETLNLMLERLDHAFLRITQFTADASHELRTPVAVIRTTAELALRRQRSTSEYEDALRDILEQSERTTELIDSLLTLARADTGKLDLDRIPLELCESLDEAIETGRKLAAAKGLQFESASGNLSLPVLGDAQALKRLALIVIDNAVKYTPVPGSVKIRLGASRGLAMLEICDTGIGIAPEDVPHIFERFYRADPSRSDAQGAGLGLAIAHWITQQHGGAIAVESCPGAGSTFRISIPLVGNHH
jgi:heavy metal sensor kinase